MTATKFVLEIEIGNDAMSLPQHIVTALAAVIKQIPNVIMSKGITTKIKDENGNSIGFWGYK
jgi:hypothetical protein